LFSNWVVHPLYESSRPELLTYFRRYSDGMQRAGRDENTKQSTHFKLNKIYIDRESEGTGTKTGTMARNGIKQNLQMNLI